MIKAINLPPNHNIFIWNRSDEKDKVLALKWYIINDCIKKVYNEPNFKTFTGENRTFHVLQLNVSIKNRKNGIVAYTFEIHTPKLNQLIKF